MRFVAATDRYFGRFGRIMGRKKGHKRIQVSVETNVCSDDPATMIGTAAVAEEDATIIGTAAVAVDEVQQHQQIAAFSSEEHVVFGWEIHQHPSGKDLAHRLFYSEPPGEHQTIWRELAVELDKSHAIVQLMNGMNGHGPSIDATATTDRVRGRIFRFSCSECHGSCNMVLLGASGSQNALYDYIVTAWNEDSGCLLSVLQMQLSSKSDRSPGPPTKRQKSTRQAALDASALVSSQLVVEQKSSDEEEYDDDDTDDDTDGGGDNATTESDSESDEAAITVAAGFLPSEDDDEIEEEVDNEFVFQTDGSDSSESDSSSDSDSGD